MTTTAHAMTGAAIATVVKKPWLAVPLAFLSHFVCDAIPHFGIGFSFGGKGMFLWLLIDGLAAMAFAVFLLKKKVANPLLMAVCGFAAMSPDLAWLYYGLHHNLNNVAAMDPISRFHAWIQWSESVPGLITDLTWTALMLWIILKVNNEDHKNTAASKAA